MCFSRARSAFPVLRFRPTLETMEGRFCPTSILDLVATVQPNNQVLLAGLVIGDDPGGLTVNFTGQYEGSTTTNTAGVFAVTIQHPGAGIVEASVANGLLSIGDSVSIPGAPIINLSVTPLDQRNVLLSGQVSDDDAGGLTVQFAGAYDGSVVTNASGSFTVTIEASQLGNISAYVTNRLGLTSNVAQDTVTSRAPTITEFSAVHEYDNYFTFFGRVDDEWAAGLQVTLGGINGLQGITVTVGEDGTFSYSVNLAEGTCGTVLAEVTDWWDLLSPEAQAYVNAS